MNRHLPITRSETGPAVRRCCPAPTKTVAFAITQHEFASKLELSNHIDNEDTHRCQQNRRCFAGSDRHRHGPLPAFL